MTTSIEENVKAMIPAMTAEIANRIKEQAARNLEHYVASAIADEVKRHIADDVVPQLREELNAQQLAIKAAVVAACKGVAEQLAATIVERMTAKLSGYEGDKLITAVFGPLFRGY